MAVTPAQLSAIDPDRIDPGIAREVLGNAQELTKAQLDSVGSLDGKLTALLSQTATLATAALAAAAAAVWGGAGYRWVPRNLAVGLAIAGIFWLLGAGLALWGLRPRAWSTPYFRPAKLIDPRVLNTSGPAMSYLRMAIWLDAGITENAGLLKALAQNVYLAQISLLLGVIALAAALAI